MNQKFFGKRTQTGPSWERTAQANCSRAKKGQSRAYWKTDNSKCYVLYRVDEVIFFFFSGCEKADQIWKDEKD